MWEQIWNRVKRFFTSFDITWARLCTFMYVWSSLCSNSLLCKSFWFLLVCLKKSTNYTQIFQYTNDLRHNIHVHYPKSLPQYTTQCLGMFSANAKTTRKFENSNLVQWLLGSLLNPPGKHRFKNWNKMIYFNSHESQIKRMW